MCLFSHALLPQLHRSDRLARFVIIHAVSNVVLRSQVSLRVHPYISVLPSPDLVGIVAVIHILACRYDRFICSHNAAVVQDIFIDLKSCCKCYIT